MNPEDLPQIAEITGAVIAGELGSTRIEFPSRFQRFAAAPLKWLLGMVLCQSVLGSLAVIGWFVLSGARSEAQLVSLQGALRGFVVADLMSPHPIVSQAELNEHIYAEDTDRDSNTVEVFIARLRRKVGATSIETVRGLGYRMADEHPAQ